MAQKKKKKQSQNSSAKDIHSKTSLDKAYVAIRKILRAYGLDPDILEQLSKHQRQFLLLAEISALRVKAELENSVPRRLVNFVSESVTRFLKTNYYGEQSMKLTYHELVTYGTSFGMRLRQIEEENSVPPGQMEIIRSISVRFNHTSLAHSLEPVATCIRKTMLMISKVNFRIYGFNWSLVEVDAAGRLKTTVFLSSEDPKMIRFTYKQNERTAFCVRAGRIISELPFDARLDRWFIYQKEEKPKVFLNIYIQSHALQRAKERMDIFPAHTRNYYVMEPLLYMQIVETGPTGQPMLACYTTDEDNDEEIRFGYYTFVVQKTNLIVLTFLPLVSSDTKEGHYFKTKLGLQKEDIQFLGMDKLSFFLTVDFEQIPVLKKALVSTGIWKLIKYAAKDPELNYTIDRKKTQMVKKFFEQKIRHEESFAEPAKPVVIRNKQNSPAPVSTEEQELNRFWQIIDEARSVRGWKAMHQPLVASLSTLEIPQLVTWSSIFEEYFRRATKPKLMATAWLLDSSWDEFLGWLIAQGKNIYLNTLRDPDSLADVKSCKREAAYNNICSVVGDAWTVKTGKKKEELRTFLKELDDTPLPQGIKDRIDAQIRYAKDIDAPWEKKQISLSSLLPKLFAMFWQKNTNKEVQIKKVQALLKKLVELPKKGAGRESLDLLEQAVALIDENNMPDNLLYILYSTIAFNHMTLEHCEEAIRWYGLAIDLGADAVRAQLGVENPISRLYYHRGWCKHTIKDFEGAVEDFKQSVATGEQHYGDALYMLGEEYRTTRRFELAFESYDAAVRLDQPETREKFFAVQRPHDALSGRALSLLGMGKFEESLRDFAELIRLEPPVWENYRFAGIALAKMKRKTFLSLSLKSVAVTKKTDEAALAAKKLWVFLDKESHKKVGWFGRLLGKLTIDN